MGQVSAEAVLPSVQVAYQSTFPAAAAQLTEACTDLFGNLKRLSRPHVKRSGALLFAAGRTAEINGVASSGSRAAPGFTGPPTASSRRLGSARLC